MAVVVNGYSKTTIQVYINTKGPAQVHNYMLKVMIFSLSTYCRPPASLALTVICLAGIVWKVTLTLIFLLKRHRKDCAIFSHTVANNNLQQQRSVITRRIKELNKWKTPERHL